MKIFRKLSPFSFRLRDTTSNKTQMDYSLLRPAQEREQVVDETIIWIDVELMQFLISQVLNSQEPEKTKARDSLLYGKDHCPIFLFTRLSYLLKFEKISNIDTRTYAAELLQSAPVQNLWPKLVPAVKEKLKSAFLFCLYNESFMPIVRIVCGIVSKIADEVFKSQEEWGELLELFNCCRSRAENDEFREVGLLVLANDRRRVICESLKPSFRIWHTGVLRGLASNNLDLKLAAFGSVISLLHIFTEVLTSEELQDLSQEMKEVMFVLLEEGKREGVQKGFQEFINFLVEEPKSLTPYLFRLVSDMLEIAEPESSTPYRDKLVSNKPEIAEPESTVIAKNCAIQFLMNVVETKNLAPVLEMLSSESMTALFKIPMKMLLEIQGEMGSENAGKTETYNYGIKFLKHMSVVLSGKKIVPIAFQVLLRYKYALEWEKRHAGITMLGLISEKCSHEMIFMEDYLDQTLNVILKSFDDPHPRVLWAAYNFMQLHTGLVYLLQMVHRSKILQALLTQVSKSQNHRVELQEEAAAALLFFVRNTYKDCSTINVDLDSLSKTLLQVLKEDNTRTTRFTTISLHTLNIVVENWPVVCRDCCADYIPILLRCCSGENSELKKAAALGIRICAQFGGPKFRPCIGSILGCKSVHSLMKPPDGSCKEVLEASDIAVCAIGIICGFLRDTSHRSKLVRYWLNCLPIKHELVQAKYAHEQLCSMVESSDRYLFGNKNRNLRNIVLVCFEVVSQGTNLAYPQTVLRMRYFLKQLSRKYPEKLVHPIWLSLTEQQKRFLANN